MPAPIRPRRKFGRFEYDPATGGWIVAGLVLVVVALGTLALTHQGSPRMDDKAALQQGATIPHPSALSPAQTTGATPAR